MSAPDALSRLNAALEGRYEVDRELGEGGMATVYLARDLKHDRQVALKVLKPELAAVLGAERFLAEIRTTASFQHPHILPLFDSGEADGFLYYVMPFVEGESLREKLDRDKQLGVDEAVRIAREVADALDYAHRKDIVHRDIKPANILLHDGRAVVADFGIALAISAAGGGRMTETGLSLGTPHYMSPEQASADRDLSARSDLYSLGCVLYEMLAGHPPHTGPTAQSVLVRILTEDPRPLTEVRRSVPAHVANAVMRAIEKLPADRFESVRAFMDALVDPSFTHVGGSRTDSGRTAPTHAARPESSGLRLPELLPWGLAAAFAAAAAWLALAPSVDTPTTRVPLALGRFEPNGDPGDLRVAPSGTAFAVTFDTAGGRMLAVRRGDESDFRITPGMGRVMAPAFSPDGTWVAYGSFGEGLMKVAVSGGAPQPVVPDTEHGYMPLDWGPDGRILYYQYVDSPSVNLVPSTGGEPVRIAGGFAASGQILPGGNIVLSGDGEARFVDVGADTTWTLVPGGMSPRFLPATGRLLWVDGSGAMWAADFDPRSGVLGAQRGIVLEGVTRLYDEFARFDVSARGTLVYSTGGSEGSSSLARLATVGLDGSVVTEPLDPRQMYGARWSPDGRFVAWEGGEPGEREGADPQIYTYDMRVKSRPRRMTSAGRNCCVVWSPDGSRMVFSSEREGTDGRDLFVKSVTGDEPERLLLSLPGNQRPTQWFADGQMLIQSGANPEIWVVDLPESGSVDTASARPFFTSEDRQFNARLSPDGTLVAYDSDATGQYEVYVRSFPTAGPPEKITEGGADSPRWSADGTTLYYRSRSSRDSLWAARIDRGPPFAVLSAGPAVPWGDSLFGGDLSPSGDRFVATLRARDASDADGSAAAAVRYFVVTNWFAELDARLAGGR